MKIARITAYDIVDPFSIGLRFIDLGQVAFHRPPFGLFPKIPQRRQTRLIVLAIFRLLPMAEKVNIVVKVILFHCGPVAQSLMAAKGTVTEHKMFAKGDPGSGWGSNEGRIKAFPTTLANCQTKDGKIVVYASEGEFTKDKIENGFFGCGGVAKIPNLQAKLVKLARGGFKHHTSVGVGHMKAILAEAFTTYLNYDWVDIDA